MISKRILTLLTFEGLESWGIHNKESYQNFHLADLADYASMFPAGLVRYCSNP